MFGLFKKQTELQKLNIQYKRLLEEAYQISTYDRKLSYEKAAEANNIAMKIDQLIKKK